MVELTEPEMNENIYASIERELYRFPYLSDVNRNPAGVAKLIAGLFNAPNSMAIEYPGGYLVFRCINEYSADLFWLHFEGEKLSHRRIKDAAELIDAAMDVLGIRFLTMKTADYGVVKLAKLIGFRDEVIEKYGFEWHGRKMPMYHLIKEGEDG
jgi:hypothetical protein